MMFDKKDATLALAWTKAFPFYAATSKKDTPSQAQVTVHQLENRSITDVNGDKVWFFSSEAARQKFTAHYPKARPFQELVVSPIVQSQPQSQRPAPAEPDTSEEGKKVAMIRQIDIWVGEGNSNPTVLAKLNKMGWDIVKIS